MTERVKIIQLFQPEQGTDTTILSGEEAIKKGLRQVILHPPKLQFSSREWRQFPLALWERGRGEGSATRREAGHVSIGTCSVILQQLIFHRRAAAWQLRGNSLTPTLSQRARESSVGDY
jgi:hypothetical protein